MEDATIKTIIELCRTMQKEADTEIDYLNKKYCGEAFLDDDWDSLNFDIGIKAAVNRILCELQSLGKLD